MTDEAKLKEYIKDEVVSEKPLPQGGSSATHAISLALTENKAAAGAQKCLRVWLRNKSAKGVTLPVGTLFGQGGQGSFVSLVSAPLEEDKRSSHGGTHASQASRNTMQSSPMGT